MPSQRAFDNQRAHCVQSNTGNEPAALFTEKEMLGTTTDKERSQNLDTRGGREFATIVDLSVK